MVLNEAAHSNGNLRERDDNPKRSVLFEIYNSNACNELKRKSMLNPIFPTAPILPIHSMRLR